MILSFRDHLFKNYFISLQLFVLCFEYHPVLFPCVFKRFCWGGEAYVCTVEHSVNFRNNGKFFLDVGPLFKNGKHFRLEKSGLTILVLVILSPHVNFIAIQLVGSIGISLMLTNILGESRLYFLQKKL